MSGASLAKFALGVAGVGSAALAATKLVTSFLNTAAELDKLGKTSDKLGVATERLIGLQFAAEQTGVNTDTLNMALQRMVRRVAEAAQGTGEAKGALIELGISAKQLNELAPDKQFELIADAMQRVDKQSDKVRLAMKLFDSEGVALVNTLALGSQGLSQMHDEAARLGIAFDRDLVGAFERYNDAVFKLSKSMKGTLVPAFAAVAEDTANLINLWTGAFEAQERALAQPTARTRTPQQEAELAADRERERLARIRSDIQFASAAGFGPATGRMAALREREQQSAAELAARERRLADLMGPPEGAAGGLFGMVSGAIDAAVGGMASSGTFAAGIGSSVGRGLAPLVEQAELSSKLAKATTQAVSGAAALDQAKANRDAKSVLDPQLKVQNQIAAAIDTGVEVWERIETLLTDRLEGVAVAGP